MALKFKFNEILEFPCDQHLRIIVDTDERQPQLLIKHINEIIDNGTSEDGIIDSRQSANGKYTSYTVRVTLPSAEIFEKLYETLPKQSFVKHMI